MAFDSDSSLISNLFRRNKRCFLILLLFNVLLACMYYLYAQNQSSIKENVRIYFKRFEKKMNGTDPIRTVLESEYDHNDLEVFYNLVHKEFALGLRCMRKADQSVTISNSNINDTDQTNSNRTQSRYEAELFKHPSYKRINQVILECFV